jgi:hypothetical protein
LFSPGDCILIVTNTYEDGTEKAHLFIVITEAVKKTDKIILVPLCSIQPNLHYDKTIILEPGEHDFIKEPTYVDYSSARVVTSDVLDGLIVKKQAKNRPPKMDEILVNRIRNGILNSRETPNFIRSHYIDYLIKQ